MTETTLIPSQRQEEIHALLQKRRFASVKALANALAVSEMTIRRDLEVLALRGVVERVFGGAQLVEKSGQEQGFVKRLSENTEAKERIARKALELVFDGDTVAIDASTTSVFLARQLNGREISVVTNSLLVAQALADSRTQVLVLGGSHRVVAGSLTGPVTEANLQGIHVDKVFFSAKGVSANAGFTDPHLPEVAVKRLLLAAASQRVALVDKSKFGQTALHSFAPLSGANLLISDANPPVDIRDGLEAAGASVEVASG
ncbi:MAG: DeoR/GlpR family DNA-binding transcription regulator [Deinococcus sp.]|nr:DeoR/GlpR family DNA-binding transcription regulator [Deinococcus sp.]